MEHSTKLEVIESIRFFGSVASTNGVAEEAKTKANKHIVRLIDSLGPEVDRILAEASGLQL